MQPQAPSFLDVLSSTEYACYYVLTWSSNLAWSCDIPLNAQINAIASIWNLPVFGQAFGRWLTGAACGQFRDCCTCTREKNEAEAISNGCHCDATNIPAVWQIVCELNSLPVPPLPARQLSPRLQTANIGVAICCCQKAKEQPNVKQTNKRTPASIDSASNFLVPTFLACGRGVPYSRLLLFCLQVIIENS